MMSFQIFVNESSKVFFLLKHAILGIAYGNGFK